MFTWDEATVKQNLCAQAIGGYVMTCMQNCDYLTLAEQVDSEAVRLVEEIKAILDDDTLDDPECFERIELFIKAFYHHGIPNRRHSEYE